MVSKNKTVSFQMRGQAALEFALVLPLLLLVVVGLLEVGRAIFMFSSATNASRDAVRYASAFGVNTNEDLHYQDCAGIRNTARRSAILLTLDDDDIEIDYDTGFTHDPDGIPDSGDEYQAAPTDADVFDTCDDTTDGTIDGVDEAVELTCGDRVVVTVTVFYSPMVNIIPMLDEYPIVSRSARTFYGNIEVGENADNSCD